jgi:hypothetical protein
MRRNTSLRVLDLYGSSDIADGPFPSRFHTVWPSLFDTIRTTQCPLEELNIKDIFLSPGSTSALASFLRRSDNTLTTFIGNACFREVPDAVPNSQVKKIGFRTVPSDFAQKLIDAPTVNLTSLSIGEVRHSELRPLVAFIASPKCSLVEFTTCWEYGRGRHRELVNDSVIIQLATALSTGLANNVTMKRLHIGTNESFGSAVNASIKEIFTNLLSNPTGFEATVDSNHTLVYLRFGSEIQSSTDAYIALQLNKLPERRTIIDQKILRNNTPFNVEPFDDKVLPNLLSWMGKHPIGLRNMYSVVHQIKDLFSSVKQDCKDCTRKRKRMECSR